MTQVSDAPIRELALDTGQSFIVQAPAGSGKTELLMQRFLALLTQVEHPEEIIAITFTRKAAAEMRGRILEALLRASSEPTPTQPHELRSWQLAQQALQRDGELQWHLLDNPNRLRIQTIDALSANLSRQMPILSRAGVNPQTTDKADELYLQAARATLNSFNQSEPIAFLLGHLDNNWQRLEDLLIALLKRRDHWLRHLPPTGEPAALDAERQNLQDNLLAVIEESLQKPQIHTELKTDWLNLARYAAENLAQENPSHALMICADLQQWPSSRADQLALWDALISLVFTKEGGWRKKPTKTLGFPAKSAAKNPLQQERFEQHKAAYTELITQLQQITDLQADLGAIRLLPSATYTDQQWQVLQALFVVLKLAVAHLQLVFREQGKVDFTEVSLAAVQALGDADQPSDLALNLDYKIRHLLVDEFQDTSASQYTLLERLISGWEPDDGRSLFLVGDPMQSIYRFRQADVGLFIDVQQQQCLGQTSLAALQLEINFRSQPAVVDWVNQTFSLAMPQQSSVLEGAVSYTASTAFNEADSSSKVQVHQLIEAVPELEAKMVCDLIQQNSASSTAVLVRNRSHLLAIIVALRERDLAYQAVEIESLAQRPVIQDLSALCRALLHLGDKIAWLAILRAPWCGLRLDDLEQLSGRSQDTVWSLLNDPQRLPRLSEDGQARVQRLKTVIETALQQRRRQALAPWLQGVWIDLGGPACLDDALDLEDSQSFFQLIESLDDAAELSSLEQLEQALSGLYASANSSTQTCVQLMTIHKSKGLEFDCVIIPGLQRQSASDDRQLLQWAEWRNSAQDRNALLLAPIEETGAGKERINIYLNELEKQRSQHETLRLLYVACTRAKQQLHLFASAKRNSKGELSSPHRQSLLASIWPSLEASFQKVAGALPSRVLDPPQEQAKPGLPIRRLSQNWQAPPAPSPLPWQDEAPEKTNDEVFKPEFDWAGEPAKYIGIVVHRLLQQIAEQGLDQFELEPQLIQVLLLESGLPRSYLSASSEKVSQAIRNTLADPRGCWILSDQHQQAKNEYALTGQIDGKLVRVIIDRSFIDEQGVRWIIDYKTGGHQGGNLEAFLANEELRYRDQLLRYAQLIAQMEPTEIRLALYFPMLSAWREIKTS